MIEPYHCKTNTDYKNALKEIIQEIALLGLSRSDFFSIVAFYGGSALRIFYKLDRFSEDLNFSLIKTDSSFDIKKYCHAIETELKSFGLDVHVVKKEKEQLTGIKSAFIKANTLIRLLKIDGLPSPLQGIHKNEKLQIKLEVDTNPPPGADFDISYNLNPIPYGVKLYSLPCLFAGKLHAVLCREWRNNRIKGLDFYDFIWFISKLIPVHLEHLENRMKQTGHIEKKTRLTKAVLLKRLEKRFQDINFEQAKSDVLPFVRDPFSLEVWSTKFFCSLLPKLKFYSF